jgi:hypothetical protein
MDDDLEHWLHVVSGSLDDSIVEPLLFDCLSRDTVCAIVIAPESNLTLQAENPLVLIFVMSSANFACFGMPSLLDLRNRLCSPFGPVALKALFLFCKTFLVSLANITLWSACDPVSPGPSVSYSPDEALG